MSEHIKNLIISKLALLSEHNNNLIISKLASLQVFDALYWPANAKKNCFVRFIF